MVYHAAARADSPQAPVYRLSSNRRRCPAGFLDRLGHALFEYSSQKTASNKTQLLQAIKESIDHYLSENLSVASIAEKFNYNVKFGLLTNGTLREPEKLKYIVDNINYIQISYDGIPYIQDMHRPTAKGENSSLLVDSFVKFIMRNNKHFALRATVSDISVKYLEDITEFFCTNYREVRICF